MGLPSKNVIEPKEAPMITKATAALGIVFALGFGWQLSGQTSSDQSGQVFLHETFETYEAASVPKVPQLQRVELTTVVDGAEKVGAGKVARFDDSDTSKGGAMEYNLGSGPSSTLYLEFDAINNGPDKGDKSSTVIFGVGPWGDGRSLALNSKAKRAFGFEMYQQKYLKLRIGDDPVAELKYDVAAKFNVKIWVNDHDSNSLSYKRPDNGEAATLKPDSVVVWVNNALLDKSTSTGHPMLSAVTAGDAVVGRVGLSSSSSKIADFLFDNLHFEDPTGEAKSTTPASGSGSKPSESTEKRSVNGLPGAETMVYREDENAMNLFVFKPEGWQASDKRSAFVYFFGGGWTKGDPQKSAAMAAWAAKHGMVGIAPDYRTKSRFDTSPLESVADSRAAFAWVAEHASELGIDPNRIAVGGTSAGGHVAIWTAIEKSPPGSSASPKVKPAAVVLKSAVTDTSPETGYASKRFGDHALALSPIHQVDSQMPPTLIFHAAFDDLVHYSTAVTLHGKLESTGNDCELISVPVGGHNFTSDSSEWKNKINTKLETFFNRTSLLPAVQ